MKATGAITMVKRIKMKIFLRNFAITWGLVALVANAVEPARSQSVGANASISATTSSSNVALPVGLTGSVIIAPAAGSSAEVFYRFGTSNAVAALTTDKSLPSGGICVNNVGNNTYLAAITASGSASVRITQITGGCPTFAAGGGGSGGGGGGVVTQGTDPWNVSQKASTPVSATMQSAAVANGNGTNLNTTGMSSAMLTVNCAACSGGTTVNFEISQDGTNFSALNAVQIGTTTIGSTTAASGISLWEMPVGGSQAIRARISGYSAGTVTVTGTAVPVPYNAKVVAANQAGAPWSQTTLDVTVALSGMTANNAATQITLQGTNSTSVLLSGTWVGTLTPQVSADGGTTWANAQFFNPATQLFSLTVTANGTYTIFGTGGMSHARVLLSPFTSGTVTGNLRATTQAASDAAALYGLALQTGTAGAPASQVVSTQGVVSGTPMPVLPTTPAINSYVGNVNTEGTKTTYSAGVAGLAPAAAATDIFCVAGSATKTVRITRFQVTGIATAASAADVVVLKRSTANTGGTSSAPTIVPNDSNNAATTASALSYTANPTPGTLVGNVRAQKMTLSTGAGAIPIVPVVFDFTTNNSQGVVLRGVAQLACLNWNAQTITGNSVDVDAQYTEE